MASGQQFNLRWNNHTNNILQVFMEQFTNENLVDVTLSCQGQFLKAHKMVLSACSPYFQELFRQHEVQHPVIIMNGMKFADVKSVVEFMYRGEIKVLETELDGFLAAAEALQVKELSNVRNKNENIDIQRSEQPETLTSPNPSQELLGQTRSLSSSTPMHLHRKRRRRSNSSVDDISADTRNRESVTMTSTQEPTGTNSTPVDVSMNDNVDDHLSTVVKVESPDICDDDDDDEQSGRESPQLVIDLPESPEQSETNSVSSKETARGDKSLSNVSGETGDFGKPREVVEYAESTPGTSQDDAALAQQLLERWQARKQVAQLRRERSGRIPRPPNAFMIFANEWRRKLAIEHPTETMQAISVRLGIMWKNLPSNEKEGYFIAQKKAGEEHRHKYPEYVYRPKNSRSPKTL